MSTTYPKYDGDSAFTVGGSAAVSAVRVLPDHPDEQLALLNVRAGEILIEQRIVAATTSQLQDAIRLAEADLGVTYNEINARRRGEELPVDGESALLAIKADKHIESLCLGREPTQGEYLAAVKAVSS